MTDRVELKPLAWRVFDMMLPPGCDMGEALYPASRKEHANEFAKLMRGECQALYANAPPTKSSLRDAVQEGFDEWAGKPHNKKWLRKIDGTPIPNDVVVCIQSAVCRRMEQEG